MKRGSSGLSLVVGVDKPTGVTSHDVVNRCRSIFNERRVGHMGTLDPMAGGVLPICVGPATRLDAYLTGYDKRYTATIAFGVGTDTDDATGQVIRTGTVPECVRDERFASSFMAEMVGEHTQMPPAYSAIKVQGVKAYEAARTGAIIDLAPRDIEIYDARLLAIGQASQGGLPTWDVEVHVSKGTYIRALARDMGVALGTPAHVVELTRTALGNLELCECVSLETLAEFKERSALDPVQLLGFRLVFASDSLTQRVENGAALSASEVVLFERPSGTAEAELCACTSGVRESTVPPKEGEVVAVIVDNRLKALYEYRDDQSSYLARCVFQTGVSRGENR